jgi:hypothetical protein
MEAIDIRFLVGTAQFAEIIVFWFITRGRVVVFQTFRGNTLPPSLGKLN